MCGICGFIGSEDKKLLQKMADLIAYRGPDDEGLYVGENACLANRRLSIIDLAGGHQPVHNEDETKWIVYNGELYNYRELRAALEKKHDFYTNSDTEVIIHAFEEWGEECVKRFNGMFAFAIWDSEKRKLLAARDRLGIKPFYYFYDGKNFVFGSEVKSILAHPKVPRRVNRLALHYLLNLSAIVGEETMFEGVKKLLPGHFLVFDERLQTKRFWRPKFSPKDVPFDKAVAEFRRKLEGAVHSQMVSDVPIGALLSGGMDSSSVVALMSKFSERPVKTFSMGFGGSTDELDDARLVAEALGAEHTEFVIDPYEAFKIYPKLIWHLDQPKVNNIYSFFVYEKVRKKVTVCLSGMGGDEIVGGYVPRHNQIRFASSYNLAPRLLRKIVAGMAGKMSSLIVRANWLELDRLRKYLRFLTHSSDWAAFYLKVGGQMLEDSDLKKIYGPELAGFGEKQITAFFKQIFENDLRPQEKFVLTELETSLPDDLLLTEDAMSMANSLEVRVPLLDNELVDYSEQLPFSFKYAGGRGKIVFKSAVKDLLPARVFKKPKAGFGPKLFEWYSRGVRPLAQQVLDNPVIVKKGFVKKEYIDAILSKPLNSLLSRHYAMIESLVGLEVWFNTYIMSEGLQPAKVF